MMGTADMMDTLDRIDARARGPSPEPGSAHDAKTWTRIPNLEGRVDEPEAAVAALRRAGRTERAS